MKHKGAYLIAVFGMGLIFIGTTFAQRPATDVDASRHPNLAEAQHHILQAFEKVEEAQKDNKYELGGHADKAKELLEHASKELKEAAEFANSHPRK